MSIIYLADRWKQFYMKNVTNHNLYNGSGNETEINFEEVLKKLKIDKRDLQGNLLLIIDLSFKILSVLLNNKQ